MGHALTSREPSRPLRVQPQRLRNGTVVSLVSTPRLVRPTSYRIVSGSYPELRFVGTRKTVEDLIETSRASAGPTIILLEVLFEGSDDVPALRQICAHEPSVVIVLAQRLDDPEMVRRGLERGARAFSLRNPAPAIVPGPTPEPRAWSPAPAPISSSPARMPLSPARRALLATGGALVGFAANSLLCRAALGAGSIDAWSFTAVRLGAGALTLSILVRLMGAEKTRGAGSAGSALALWAYAAAFSLAYLRLSTGVGALVLFAAVQATMIGWGLARGARPSAVEWTGLAVALTGLVVLTLPGATLPDPTGLALMAVAGAAWGVYSLRGRSNRAPIAATAHNFVFSVPLALAALVLALVFAQPHASSGGVWLALGSGALASGLGYCLWYTALPALSAMSAALVQLLVPVLAAVAGIVVLGERPTLRLAIAGPLILCGVACAVLGRSRQKSSAAAPAPAATPATESSN